MRQTPFVIALGFAGILSFAFAVAPASAQNRSGGGGARAAAAPRYYGGARYYGGRYYYGSWYYAPVRFFSPYYAFRPRVSVGFGLSIGYPVPYGYSYYYPYPPTYYQAPAGLDRQYPPESQKSVGVQPGPPQAPAGLDPIGGLSFEITPSDARVFVDGHDVGSVGQFTPTSQALGLPVGRHHIEIVANGYRTMSSDVDVRAGEVIPFQGEMER
jgi:hypothetical protein